MGLDTPDVAGPLNLTAPAPPNATFAILSARPASTALAPAPAFALAVACEMPPRCLIVHLVLSAKSTFRIQSYPDLESRCAPYIRSYATRLLTKIRREARGASANGCPERLSARAIRRGADASRRTPLRLSHRGHEEATFSCYTSCVIFCSRRCRWMCGLTPVLEAVSSYRLSARNAPAGSSSRRPPLARRCLGVMYRRCRHPRRPARVAARAPSHEHPTWYTCPRERRSWPRWTPIRGAAHARGRAHRATSDSVRSMRARSGRQHEVRLRLDNFSCCPPPAEHSHGVIARPVPLPPPPHGTTQFAIADEPLIAPARGTWPSTRARIGTA